MDAWHRRQNSLARPKGDELQRSMKPLFAATIFLSAFLLFQVQPISARFVVPWFGGSAAVWTACLLFFQIALLLGYLYAHASIRLLQPRAQGILHVALLGISAILFPIEPSAALKPVGDQEPVWQILRVLAATVGLKYLLLSTTGPLLQAWYAARRTGTSYPYRLYSLSNIGSLLALLGYPVFVEPRLTLHQQAAIWTGGYFLFALLCATVALTTPNQAQEKTTPDKPAGDTISTPGALQYLVWIVLSAVPSALLLAVTNHISQNIAAVPLLWVLPLALYLLTFIVCFGEKEWRWRAPLIPMPAVGIVAMVYGLVPDNENSGVNTLLPIFLGGLFVCCLLCHGELARRKPVPQHLTAFYLCLSVGGALGGAFVALLAPHLFHADWELPITIGACALIALFVLYRDRGARLWEPSWLGLAALTVGLCWYLYTETNQSIADCRLTTRNFYGILQVRDYGDPTADPTAYRALMNGTILHGSQMLDPAQKDEPTTYYSRKSGIGLAIVATRRGEVAARGQRVGIIGLGTGTCATYGRPGDHYWYLDINPQVIQIASTQFSFLKDSKATITTLLGDARLTLEREKPLQLDVLGVDAFSSDSIPIHLLTREAFAIYFKHLKPTGVLCVHVSNRHVRLQPVVASIAQEMGKSAITILNDADDDHVVTQSEWVLVTSNPVILNDPAIKEASTPAKTEPGFRTWSDDYSNLFQLVNY